MPTPILQDGELLSRSHLEDFVKGDIWSALLFDIDERSKYLFELFRDGDETWSAEFIRGMLMEHEFFKQIPNSLIASIIIKEANLKQREEKRNEISESN